MSRRLSLVAGVAAIVLFSATGLLVSRVLEPDEPAALPSVPRVVDEEVAEEAAAIPAPQGGGGSARYATSAECPAMNNPGGLDWTPKANAGPFPTDGAVVLPTLAVSAPIVKVGVGTDGAMVVPKNARDVAWLDQGGIPGKTNNVVLAGHISYSRVAGSFFRLRELQNGDAITVEMGGKHYKYNVVWNCFFDRNTDAAGQIMGKTNVPSVTLISCGGVFDSSARTHTQRIAVRAEMRPVDTPAPTSAGSNPAASAAPSPGGLLDGLRR